MIKKTCGSKEKSSFLIQENAKPIVDLAKTFVFLGLQNLVSFAKMSIGIGDETQSSYRSTKACVVMG